MSANHSFVILEIAKNLISLRFFATLLIRTRLYGLFTNLPKLAAFINHLSVLLSDKKTGVIYYNMKVHLDCIPCFLRQALQAARFATNNEQKHEDALRASLEAIAESNWHATPSEIGIRVHFTVMDVLDIKDPYREKKIKSNAIVLDMYEYLQKEIGNNNDPVDKAIRFAIAGNIMDYGAKSEFNIHDTLQRLKHEKLKIDHSMEFRHDIKNVDTIAYLTDNAGEIVFDRLLMETIDKTYGKKKWHVFVKAKPIINDATLDTAKQAGLGGNENIIIDVIDFGRDYDDRTDPAFLEKLATYDVVISKGQGNYEALSDVSRINFYFLLMAKCPVVARDIGVDTGDILLIRQSHKD